MTYENYITRVANAHNEYVPILPHFFPSLLHSNTFIYRYVFILVQRYVHSCLLFDVCRKGLTAIKIRVGGLIWTRSGYTFPKIGISMMLLEYV